MELRQILAGPHSVVFEGSSEFQELLVIKSNNLRMYLNQQLQLCSLDERIYHEALVHPAMTLALQHQRVLIVSGNDGLILREVLKYSDVERVCLADIDPKLVELSQTLPELIGLNEGAFLDNRVHIHTESLNKFLSRKHTPYNVIIVDFLDPADKHIAEKYRRKVFRRLSKLLATNGILVCQAHSPEAAPLVFWGIAQTIKSAGLKTLSYHVNVPTFGDWGFHLAGKKQPLWRGKKVAVTTKTLPEDLIPWFRFSLEVLSHCAHAAANTKGNLILHKYYRESVSSSLWADSPPLINKRVVNGTEKPLKYAHSQANEVYGDAEDLVELRQLLAGPHRILFHDQSKEHDILLIEGMDLRMYLDNQLQFSSLDEEIYHEALVHPALSIVAKPSRILIVGGGDGLAVREVLKYNAVECIDLVDLDPLVLHVARYIPEVVTLNQDSLYDERVNVYQQDAQKFIVAHNYKYNAIIVDLPDPADEVISKLYTTQFFGRLLECLTSDGVIICQSHSPKDAPTVFWTIGLTLQSLDLQILSYHIDVPTFGDWGFHIAGRELPKTLKYNNSVVHCTLPTDFQRLCEFPLEILSFKELAEVNDSERLILHELYEHEVGIES